ncbi:hypothetical protein [Neobacillus sp. YIM B06451]|uniref:hypothetical protein n=1 Tax=Neobacillus sp. YIM B06451 TaxID=3070994 RepID=UPI00292CACDF|nr:hypothetical protein [Neobacillus sp. YIM B06451]
MKVKSLIKFGLILSIILNLYLFQQLNNSKEQSRLAMFEKIQNGVNYSFNFGETLQRKYSDISIKEKSEYLTAMSWSLQLSTHTLEIVEPNDDRYRKLANLFNIYSHIPSSNDLGDMISNENVSDDEILELLNIWLTDMKYLDEKLDYNQLSKMNYTELSAYWETLLSNLKYHNDALIKYKQSF